MKIVGRSGGSVNLSEERFDRALKKIPNRERSSNHLLLLTSPTIRHRLDRTDTIAFFEALAKKTAKIRLRLSGDRNRYSDSVNEATIIILSTALRRSQHVGELIGLAQPSTIKEVARYAGRPLMGISIIYPLINATARHITQNRERLGRQSGSYTLCRYVPLIISAVLVNPEGKYDCDEYVKRIFAKLCTQWDESEELGIKAGLLMSGLGLALKKIISRAARHHGWAGVALDSSFGGLSGVPGGGFAFSAALPFVKKMVDKRFEKKTEELKKIRKAVRQDLQDKVEKTRPRKSARDRARYQEYFNELRMVRYHSP